MKELQKGGGIISVLLFIIILYSLGNTISGIISISDENVIKRIEETKSVINIFDNTHGWCGANAALFLKSIPISTHESIALQAILNKKFSFKDYITKEIKIDWELSSFQYKLTKPNLRGSIDNIDIYTSSIRNLMIILKNDVHNLDSNVGIITAFSYPTYTNGINHMVILWLTQDDHLILIDPQTYAHDDIRIYSNEINIPILENISHKYKINISNLKDYFKSNVDITKQFKILYNIHTEIVDSEDTLLDPSNPKIQKAIKNIEEARESIIPQL